MKKKTRSARPKKSAKPPRPEPKKQQKFLTCVEYASYRGISKQAVYKAISSGRIRSTEFEGRLLIDVERADRDWDSNTKTQYLPEREPPRVVPDKPSDHKTTDDLNPVLIDDENSGKQRRIAEAHKMVWEARQAELDYLREVGELVSAEKVKKEAFETARVVRDAILNIPERISAEIIGIKDVAKMHSALTRELNIALQELTSALDRKQ